MPELLEEQRENWGTRAGFVLAAIGSAVGLGNLWAFPYKVYSFGGGAFLIPYVIGMLVIGVPVLILEFSLGHMTQRAAPDAFRGINRRSEPIGWWGILLGFVIVTYYAVILAYCLNFLVVSIGGIFNGGELPWAGQGAEGVKNATTYFNDTYLNQWPADTARPWAFGNLVTPIVASLVAVWALIYLCIFRGVKLVSKVVMWTVPLPWLMLLILTIRGLTLDGADYGLEYYLRPNWAELAKPTTWRYAFGQVFFSMSLAFGVMLTYASFLHRKSDLNNNAAIIGLGDLGTSFVAGIAIFATLGAMAVATGQSVQDVATGGPGLTFEIIPYALAQFPASAWFSTIFFFALVTLGIDSAFSISESVLAALVDKLRWSRDWTLIAMVVVSLGLGLVYCTRGGLTWIGGIDDFINGPWGIALLGMLECIVLGWMYRVGRLRRHANERSDWLLGPWWDWTIRLIAPILLAALFIWSVFDQATTAGFLRTETGALVTPNVVGLILGALAPIAAVLLSLIRSPGANEHAEHVGEPPAPRTGGQVGSLLAFASLICVAVGFIYALDVKAGYDEQTGLGDAGCAALCTARTYLLIGSATGLFALVLGAGGVLGGEANGMRPSKWSRTAAGLSVLTIGCCAGLLVPLWVMAGQLDKKTEIAHAPTLSGPSYAVMAAMLALIFGGLLWCFGRALKAAGREAEIQEPEGME